jgi:hypothetical protein
LQTVKGGKLSKKRGQGEWFRRLRSAGATGRLPGTGSAYACSEKDYKDYKDNNDYNDKDGGGVAAGSSGVYPAAWRLPEADLLPKGNGRL